MCGWGEGSEWDKDYYYFISIESNLYFHNHRRVEVGRHLWSPPSPASPLQAVSPRAGCSCQPCPDRVRISPIMETPQPPLINCSRSHSKILTNITLNVWGNMLSIADVSDWVLGVGRQQVKKKKKKDKLILNS